MKKEIFAKSEPIAKSELLTKSEPFTKKHQPKKARWIILVVLLSLLCRFEPVSAEDIETSVVGLILRTGEEVIMTDYFFELLDRGDFILVPVGSLAEPLQLRWIYQQEQGILTVTHIPSGRTIQADLSHHLYIGHVEWAEEPPVVVDGEFYLTPLLLAAVSGAHFSWDAKYQELTVEGEFPARQPVLPSQPIESEVFPADNAPTGAAQSKPTFVLGSIQYKLSWEWRKGEEDIRRTGKNLQLDLFGRAADWTIALGIKDDLSNGEERPAFIQMQAKYAEHNHYIMIGDSRIDFPQYTGQKSLRGIYYQYPRKTNSQLLAYTTVTGEAGPGNKVTLYVNHLFRDELTSTDGSYTFSYVPLQWYRLNQIQVTVKTPTGEETVKEWWLAASPRMLETGEGNIKAAAGVYRDPDQWDWEGMLGGWEANWGVASNSTVHWSLLGRKPAGSGLIIGSNLGAAARLGENSFWSVDWLAAGEGDRLEHGVESELLYCLEKGYLEMDAFYLPEPVAEGIHTRTGKGVQIEGAWEPHPHWEATGTAGLAYPVIPADELFAWKGTQISLTGKWGDQWQNLLGIGGGHELLTSCMGEARAIQNTHLQFNHLLRGTGVVAKGEAKLELSHLTENETCQRLTTFFAEEESSKILSPKLLGILKGDLNAKWLHAAQVDGALDLTGELRWADENLWLSGAGLLHAAASAGSSPELQGYEFTITGKYYLAGQNTLHAAGNYVRDYAVGTQYFRGSLQGVYVWNGEKDRLSCSFEYVSPYHGRTTPQWPYRMEWSHQLPLGLELGVRWENVYDTLLDPKSETVLTLHLSHAIGIASGYVRGLAYSGGEHHSFVGGIVFLDQNGNGRMDVGEKPLPGIKMALDGKRTETDSDGAYQFDYVEPGVYRLNLDLRSLHADYVPVTGEQIVQIRENENGYFTFGVTMKGSASGRLYLDKNADGRMNEGEPALQWVGLSLDGGQRIVYTNRDGMFHLDNIALGEHTLRIIAETLPAGTALAEPEHWPLTFTVTEAKLDISGLSVRVIYQFVQ